MLNYQPLYTALFNAVTDALGALEAQNFGEARAILIAAQRACEELYITSSEEEEDRDGE